MCKNTYIGTITYAYATLIPDNRGVKIINGLEGRLLTKATLLINATWAIESTGISITFFTQLCT